jgi:hypothetical protein
MEAAIRSGGAETHRFRPFVIAGNASQSQINRYRDVTILAAARALHAMYFDAEPTEPVLILLFESRGPYARLAKKWFDQDDVPHYGFYRRRQNIMLMNVGTGTGTLVHELVHALIAPDFPAVPDWFNEGLASLYEQCSIGRDRRGIPRSPVMRIGGCRHCSGRSGAASCAASAR